MQAESRTVARWGLAAVVVFLALAAVAPFLFLWYAPIGGRRITESERPTADDNAALPAGTIRLSAADVTALRPPFGTAPSAASPGGTCLAIPEGKGDKSRCSGRAEFAFEWSGDRPARVWLRCRWNDGCGNSVLLQVGAARPVVVGQDAVYDVWHWVDGGLFRPGTGRCRLVLAEREDGIAIDQVLICPGDARFIPSGLYSRNGRKPGVRRFADRFDRSPGHGNPDWAFEAGQWGITFTLDPNRIPYQYSLNAVAEPGRWAVAALKGAPWRGARVRLNLCVPSVADGDRAAEGCAVLFRGASVHTAVVFGSPDVPLPPGVRADAVLRAPVHFDADQWYALDVRRWGWSLSAASPVEAVRDDLREPGCGRIALAVFGGRAIVDDVEVDEIPWAADDARDFRLAWAPASRNSRWYRPNRPGADWALVGREGALRLVDRLGPVAELLAWGARRDFARGLRVPGFTRVAFPGGMRFRPEGETSDTVLLQAESPCRIARLALRGHVPDPVQYFHIGPFTFDSAKIPDPSDYLDFTPEEYERIRTSPDAQRLLRKPKMVDVVGEDGQYAVWARVSGQWDVAGGVLRGQGPGARLRFWQEIEGPLRISFRVRPADAGSAAAVVLGEENGEGVIVKIVPGGADSNEADVVAASPGKWTSVQVDLGLDAVRRRTDGRPWRTRELRRGAGGGILLAVLRGRAEFDDVGVDVPRRLFAGEESAFFYAFDRREPDWRRRGRWIDHGGISCALASEWVSLVAPHSEGWLILSRNVDDHMLAAFNIEENSEWFGWNRRPTHVHYPFDNICMILAESPELTRGYRIEVNAENRTATVLYRNGREVARVRQDARFPIQYRGGHAPYRPRRNRIRLVRRGGVLRVVINGREVLAYRDRSPLQTPVLALGGYNTRVNFSRIVVRSGMR